MIQDVQPSTILSTAPGASDIDLVQALRDENERLRAEVANLKKLHALIREKELVVLRKRESSSN